MPLQRLTSWVWQLSHQCQMCQTACAAPSGHSLSAHPAAAKPCCLKLGCCQPDGHRMCNLAAYSSWYVQVAMAACAHFVNITESQECGRSVWELLSENTHIGQQNATLVLSAKRPSHSMPHMKHQKPGLADSVGLKRHSCKTDKATSLPYVPNPC